MLISDQVKNIMAGASKTGTDFIEQAKTVVLQHISDEKFGVAELAEALHMSRSNLLRKTKKLTGLSVSQFIRHLRLDKSMELLRQGDLTVSEISYEVGFGSTSYFIKCFREHYGYPPGEASRRSFDDAPVGPGFFRRHRVKILAGAFTLLVLVVAGALLTKGPEPSDTGQEKSIAVLPFKNESGDSTNIYFINGLMESTLNNLQKIEDLRVISRTSAEKYRNTGKTIPEIAGELGVNYFVEGSGQKIGDQVLLHIQLIEAKSDRPLWSEQYNRQVGDIFALQNEVARQIAAAIQAVVTPDELALIEKKPTENLLAYDYYLRGLEPMYAGTREGWEQAIPLFEKAIGEDPQFALAYADIAIAYFFLDQYKREKQYTEEINNYADKALLYDSKSAESLIAKAMYYMQIEDYRLALPHLEKALEYNPNSAAVVQILADYYARIIPDTGKYLEYALKGVQLDIASRDSATNSYTYLHLSNALIQSGFVEESLRYIDKSLAYNPQNPFAPYLKAYILYARDRDLEATTERLSREWKKDTTRLDILQEVGKMHYFQEAYDSAFYYYEKFVRARERAGLEIFPQEDIKIGVVYEKAGHPEIARELFDAYEAYCQKDRSIYKSASTAMKYAQEGDYDKALEQLKVFATQDNYQYWILLFMERDPLIKPLKAHPEYEAVMQKIRDRFWENQRNLRKSLEEKGLL
ncbi:MAG: helix-turn-helix domain-containing protein [Robiginitalea sp.]